MKTLLFFTALLAVAASYPIVRSWTLYQLSEAIETKKHPELTPYLIDALNQIMLAIFTGNGTKQIQSTIPSPSGSPTWTVDELEQALENRTLAFDYKNAIRQAFEIYKQRTADGEQLSPDNIEVAIVALDVSLWTESDLNEALNSSATKAELIPYLEKARRELKEAIEQGKSKDKIGMVTPVGLIPHKENDEFSRKVSKRFFKKTRNGL